MNTDLLDQVTRAATPTEVVLTKIGPADRLRPTPCPEMTVVDVASHLIGGVRGMTTVANGGELSFDAGLDPDLGDQDIAAVFRSAVDELLVAFGAPGRIDTGYAMPWGTTTGAQLLGFELIEIIVHGWDIGRGLGVDLDVDDDVVAATLAGARMWVDDSVRVPGMFGPEVHGDYVAPLDQLVAFLGRNPAWTP